MWSGNSYGGAILQVGQAFMQHSRFDHLYRMAQMESKLGKKLARQNAMLQTEKLNAHRLQLGRYRKKNLFEIQKAQLRALGEINAEAGASGKTGRSIDRAVFDVYNEASMAEGEVNSQFDEGMRMARLEGNSIAQGLHAGLLNNRNTTRPGDSTALMLNLLNAGLTAYNAYQENKDKKERAIMDSAAASSGPATK